MPYRMVALPEKNQLTGDTRYAQKNKQLGNAGLFTLPRTLINMEEISFLFGMWNVLVF